MTTLPRKRRQQPPVPKTYNLHQIEAWASMDGNEVHYDPRRIRIMRKIVEYTPCPQAGPGQWSRTYLDDVADAALFAANINGITADMFRALQAFDPKTASAIENF